MLLGTLPEHIHYVNVCGLGNSGPNMWMSKRENQFNTQFSRVQQKDWDYPEVSTWVLELRDHIKLLKANYIILIGHSMGCATIAHYKNSHLFDNRIKGCFLVGPANVCHALLPETCQSFEDFPDIQNPIPTQLIISENDPYCDLKTALHYSEIWGAEYLHMGKQGHFCGSNMYVEWKEGFEILKDFSDKTAMQIS